MRVFHAGQTELRAEAVILPQFHNEAMKMRQVVVAFGMPYETLLGVICHSVQNARTAGEFFNRIYPAAPAAVGAYINHFVLRLHAELDFNDPALAVKEFYKHSPMDFARPSPTRGFSLPAFFSEIVCQPALNDIASGLPLRITRTPFRTIPATP